MFVTHLSCGWCGRSHDHHLVHGLCDCGGPLLVEYDLQTVRRRTDPGALEDRPAGLWRYRELLPVENPDRAVSLGEGGTPLLPLPDLGRAWDLQLWVKHEAPNPTGTFKARGAAVGVTRARELGIAEVCLPTAGNAGGAWACYGAAASLRVHVAMPRDAPEINRLECQAHGAELELVDGSISDAGEVVRRWVADSGWIDVSTLREPYRLEGKKTLGLEIAQQFRWRFPDAVVCPVGGGMALLGIWRAIGQLQALGWVDGPIPRLVAVQAAGCAPVVRALEEGAADTAPWPDAATVAAGLRVPEPLGGRLILRAIRETGGTGVAVPDDRILEALGLLARRAGILAAPEGAASIAAVKMLRERGDLPPGGRIVALNTGSGLKYPETLAAQSGSEGASE